MDRDRDRRRDFPPEDQYGTGRGQSYRPGNARERTPPPRADTYRARSPPRRNDYADTYRVARPRSRSPARRDDFPRRSSSPARFPRDRDARVGGGDSYRGHPRSPPPVTRREELPRDDLFRREPSTRDGRDYRDERGGYRDEREYDRDRGYGAPPAARSPPPPRYRDRSPVSLKRGREPSAVGSRGRRSPPPAKRERVESPRGRYEDYPPSRPQSPPRRKYSPDPRERRASPPRPATRDYRMRSRSPPPRNEKAEPRATDGFRRPRSPSPGRFPRQDYPIGEETGARGSGTTSRHTSPPLHPSRMQHVDDRAGRPTPRDAYDNREPYRARSPEPRRAASPVPRERDDSEDRGYGATDDRIPPPREPYRPDDVPPQRAPPTGPAGYRAPMAPPTGPAAANSISAHARAPPVPPSGPRSAGAPRGDFGAPRGRGGFRGDFRGDFGGGRGGFGGPPPFRGGRGGGPPGGFAGRGGPPQPFSRKESFDREMDYNNGPPPSGRNSIGPPPSGPRGSFSGAAPPPPQPYRQSNNSTATTYPRTQRFGPGGQPIPDSPGTGTPTGPRASRADRPHPALAELPKPIEGGQKSESLVDRTKLDKLQEEAEKLRKAIEEKEARKRKGLREWERLGRETEAAGFRTQLAEEALRNANGEAEGAAAF
ncbi:hypothetical protein LTR37_015838 [Vermiconidia calcicola]|uniref:Uncharacterized protein n=1 Tax=Vermiconidia calcicola TaxID=1690605 RepID=A0ACC3MPJ2_9PEZI|nr:hypothetical protein LTR37_015838 [Vermiconidia calcicola]